MLSPSSFSLSDATHARRRPLRASDRRCPPLSMPAAARRSQDSTLRVTEQRRGPGHARCRIGKNGARWPYTKARRSVAVADARNFAPNGQRRCLSRSQRRPPRTMPSRSPPRLRSCPLQLRPCLATRLPAVAVLVLSPPSSPPLRPRPPPPLFTPTSPTSPSALFTRRDRRSEPQRWSLARTWTAPTAPYSSVSLYPQ